MLRERTVGVNSELASSCRPSARTVGGSEHNGAREWIAFFLPIGECGLLIALPALGNARAENFHTPPHLAPLTLNPTQYD